MVPIALVVQSVNLVFMAFTASFVRFWAALPKTIYDKTAPGGAPEVAGFLQTDVSFD